jgi:hypothetical protein
MNPTRLLLTVLPWLLLILSSLFIWKQCTNSTPVFESKPDEIVVNHNMVVERIEALGKIELVKYYIKDIVEHEVIKDWWPDPKVVLIISGEAVGCLDLTKMDSTKVQISQDTIKIKLPQPQVCYYKINHKESKVYSVQNEYFSEAALIDKAYKMAEKQLEVAATKMKIL